MNFWAEPPVDEAEVDDDKNHLQADLWVPCQLRALRVSKDNRAERQEQANIHDKGLLQVRINIRPKDERPAEEGEEQHGAHLPHHSAIDAHLPLSSRSAASLQASWGQTCRSARYMPHEKKPNTATINTARRIFEDYCFSLSGLYLLPSRTLRCLEGLFPFLFLFLFLFLFFFDCFLFLIVFLFVCAFPLSLSLSLSRVRVCVRVCVRACVRV